MSRHPVSGIAPRLACVVLGALSLGVLASCTTAEAVAAGTGRLEHVRLGFGLDPAGRVGTGCASSSFSLTDPIHLSMEVTGATQGSLVSVIVRDVDTQRIAWREERPVPPGGSYQTFEIGTAIPAGRYRVDSKLGDRARNPRPFVVHAKLRSSR